MEIIPAIDIQAGQCVRLYQGDFSKTIVYSENPLSVAQNFQHLGAKRLHVIDLDGAKTGTLVNFELVKTIAEQVNLSVQFGGGLRTIAAIERTLASRIERVLLGSILFEPKYLEQLVVLLQKYPERLIAVLDVRDGHVALHGWQENSGKSVVETGEYLLQLGFKRILATDILADGTMKGPNFKLYKDLKKTLGFKIIASGGVSSYEDIEKLEQLGIEAVVVGKALYAGVLDAHQLFS